MSGITKFEKELIEFEGKKFAAIKIYEAENKPVILRKNNGNHGSEGDIYFRYRGQTKKIRFEELNKIIDENSKKEAQKWINLFENAKKVGIENVHLLDLSRGTIDLNDKKVLLDKKILDKLAFIKEGEFNEKVGAPAIKIVGEIEGTANVIANKKVTENIEKSYPLIRKQVLADLKIKSHHFDALVWKLGIKDNNKYVKVIPHGKNNICKYSTEIVPHLKIHLQDKEKEYLPNLNYDYTQSKNKRVKPSAK